MTLISSTFEFEWDGRPCVIYTKEEDSSKLSLAVTAEDISKLGADGRIDLDFIISERS